MAGDEDIGWADTIFVMEPRHKRMLRERLGAELPGNTPISLDIRDDDAFKDDDLVALLQVRLSPHLEGIE